MIFYNRERISRALFDGYAGYYCRRSQPNSGSISNIAFTRIDLYRRHLLLANVNHFF